MTYLLDANTCIRYLNGLSGSIRRRVESTDAAELALCSIVKAELFYGAFKSARPDANLARLARFFEGFVSLPCDDAAAEVYGEVRARLERRGLPIGPHGGGRHARRKDGRGRGPAGRRALPRVRGAGRMKTTVSIAADLFAEAERLARRLKISRSELYARALAEYLARRRGANRVTERMNRVIEDVGEEADPFVSAAAQRILERIEW